MKRYRLFDPDTELSPTAQLIMSEDIEGLKATCGIEWELNEVLHICKYIDELPINLALIESKAKVIDYLLSQNVDLNVAQHPAITEAVKNCDLDTINKIIVAGADVNAIDHVGKNAVSSALYEERLDVLPLLAASGLDINADRGASFCQAVFGGNPETVKALLDMGADPNLHQPGMIFPHNPTSVGVAASSDNFEMVKLLVEHGANATIPNAHGVRPYLSAVENDNAQMQSFLRALEPDAWHDVDQKIRLLKEYGVPDAMIDFLKGADRRIDLEVGKAGYGPKYIVFHPLIDVVEMNWGNQSFLSLLSEIEDYGGPGFLVWYKRGKCLGSIDVEHGQFRRLCRWKKFMKKPSRIIARLFV